MRLTVPVAIAFIALTTPSHAQTVISQFDFEEGSMLTAAQGTNATSVGAGVSLVAPGSGTTGKGLAPNGNNINLVVPGAQYKTAGFDISIDFMRKENNASFFALGGLDLGINTGASYAKFVLNNGGTDVPVSITNFETVPNQDGLFHTYRYAYDPTTGYFRAWVDGALQTSRSVGSAGEQLSWTGATTASIGSTVDGSGASIAVLDNFIYATPAPFTVLAASLISFDVTNRNGAAQLNWSASETTGEFTIERSSNGTNYTSIGTVTAVTGNDQYQYTDNTPVATNFYRLKTTTGAGNTTYSAVRKLSFETTGLNIRCYPNPVVNTAMIRLDNSTPEIVKLDVYSLDGRLIRSTESTANPGQDLALDLSTAPQGILLIAIQNQSGTQTAKIFKR